MLIAQPTLPPLFSLAVPPPSKFQRNIATWSRLYALANNCALHQTSTDVVSFARPTLFVLRSS